MLSATHYCENGLNKQFAPTAHTPTTFGANCNTVFPGAEALSPYLTHKVKKTYGKHGLKSI